MEEEIQKLEDKAVQIRKQICEIAYEIGVIHIGGILSAVDVVVALYYRYLEFNPDDIDKESRNKFILSKGHSGVLLYVIFCDLGLYEWDEVFLNYNKLGNLFGQHPNRKLNKGIEVSTGSLGHGLSITVGMALANKSKNITSYLFCMTGDGEMQEGSNWEAIMYAGSHHLSNIVCIVDFNQSTSCYRYGDNIVLDWEKSFCAFGWDVCTIDGSDMGQIVNVFENMPEVDFTKEAKPLAIISKTVKGQDVDFMEGPAWHYGSLDEKLLNRALESIENNRKKCR